MIVGYGDGEANRPARPMPACAPDGLGGQTTDSAPTRPAMIRQYELTEKIHAYDAKADTRLIDAAYVMAMQAHGTQRRDNGDPYFSHPVAVADILAGYRLDTAAIATGLLHDLIQDPPAKPPAMHAR